MAVKLSPLFQDAQLDANGDPLSGGKLYTYAAGTTTNQATYTTSTGATPQANPIVLNSRGEPDNPIWLTDGASYKFVLKTSADVTIRTVDNVAGVNDSTTTVVDQWVTPSVSSLTYVSATSFTVAGDQTSLFHVGRRVKATVTAGTVYATIVETAFTTLTTVTLAFASGSLDSGLSAIQIGLITATNTGAPFSRFKVGSFTRDISTASGSQSVTGVLFKPTRLILMAGNTGGATYGSIGFATASAAGSLYSRSALSAGTFGISGNPIVLILGASDNYQGALSSFDNDGFTISWTKAGTTSGTVEIRYLAED